LTAVLPAESMRSPHNGCAGEVIESCPFCSSNDQKVYEIDASVWAVHCGGCKTLGPHATTGQDAIARWGKTQR
jgi:hypothetical protein